MLTSRHILRGNRLRNACSDNFSPLSQEISRKVQEEKGKVKENLILVLKGDEIEIITE